MIIRFIVIAIYFTINLLNCFNISDNLSLIKIYKTIIYIYIYIIDMVLTIFIII